MNILEKEIEDIIFDNANYNSHELSKRGLLLHSKMTHLRQVDLGSYGRADIVGFLVCPKDGGMRRILVHILEIKKDQINLETLLQAIRYARGIQRLCARLKDTDIEFTISLVGKSIDCRNDFVYAADLFPNVNFYTYAVDLYAGVQFKKEYGFFTTNEKLPDLSEQMDYVLFQLDVQINRPTEDLPF